MLTNYILCKLNQTILFFRQTLSVFIERPLEIKIPAIIRGTCHLTLNIWHNLGII